MHLLKGGNRLDGNRFPGNRSGWNRTPSGIWIPPPITDGSLAWGIDVTIPDYLTLDNISVDRVDPFTDGPYATATGLARPTWDESNYMYLDDVNDILYLSSTLGAVPPITLYRLVNHVSGFMTLGTYGGPHSYDMSNIGSYIRTQVNTISNRSADLAGFTNNNWQMETMVYTGVGSPLIWYEDGVEIARDNAGNGTPFAATAIGGFDGSYLYGNGYIGVILACTSAHDVSQVADVAAWGLEKIPS